MKIRFTLFFLLAIILKIQAQDPRFSQFYASPLNLNPALAGVFSGQSRAILNYRNQWASVLGDVPFRTFAGSYEVRNRVKDDDYAGVGIALLRDEAGTSNMRQTKGNLSLSYMKQVAGGKYSADQYIILGAQFGLTQIVLDANNLWFSRQYDPIANQVNTNIASGESVQNSTNPYMDLSAGLVWYMATSDRRGAQSSAYAGASVFHLNAPTFSFVGGTKEAVYWRWVLHGGGELAFSDKLSLLPGIVAMKQGPAFDVNMGTSFRYNHQGDIALRTGAWLRFARSIHVPFGFESIVIGTTLETGRWNLGVSYDFNASSIKRVNYGRGAFELSLMYIHPERRRNSVTCPRF